MSKVFDWDEQYAIGKNGENEVFELLDSKGWKVEPVQDLFLQARGMDAFITSKEQSYSVEIKTDLRSAQTGNAFLEHTITRGPESKPGWSLSACAQLILYFVPGRGIYGLNAVGLREYINAIYPEREVKNEAYTAQGYIVPLGLLYNRVGVFQHEW